MKRTNTMTYLRSLMPKCPICGAKAFLSHDVVDRTIDFGYSGGCPNFCLKDGIHGIDNRYDPRAPRVTGYNANMVYNAWVNYCKWMEENYGKSEEN